MLGELGTVFLASHDSMCVCGNAVNVIYAIKCDDGDLTVTEKTETITTVKDVGACSGIWNHADM
jgi:hypothetical protein